MRRRGSKAWGIPKGVIERGDTPRETAVTEAWEEAGLEGRVVGRPLGTYEYEKWDTTLLVVVYLMHVQDQRADWPEIDLRQRKWISFRQAASLLVKHPARSLLTRARAEADRI